MMNHEQQENEISPPLDHDLRGGVVFNLSLPRTCTDELVAAVVLKHLDS